MESTPDPSVPARPSWLRSLGDLLWVIYLGGLGVAAFAFGVSYTHIYDLGAAHGGTVSVDRMLPLSVDLLIVVASVVVLRQSKLRQRTAGLARWMPRGVMWAGIAATVAANVAYGSQFGVAGMFIWGWPGAAFVMVVEMIMVAVRPDLQTGPQDGKLTAVIAGKSQIPATSYDAAATAYAASVAGSNPLSDYQLSKRFGITRGQARKIVTAPAPEPSMNGASPGA